MVVVLANNTSLGPRGYRSNTIKLPSSATTDPDEVVNPASVVVGSTDNPSRGATLGVGPYLLNGTMIISGPLNHVQVSMAIDCRADYCVCSLCMTVQSLQ